VDSRRTQTAIAAAIAVVEGGMKMFTMSPVRCQVVEISPF
jgi:hypothetical protein